MTLPLFFNNLFTYLFSIKSLYYFNIVVSIAIQFYGNSSLHYKSREILRKKGVSFYVTSAVYLATLTGKPNFYLTQVSDRFALDSLAFTSFSYT